MYHDSLVTGWMLIGILKCSHLEFFRMATPLIWAINDMTCKKKIWLRSSNHQAYHQDWWIDHHLVIFIKIAWSHSIVTFSTNCAFSFTNIPSWKYQRWSEIVHPDGCVLFYYRFRLRWSAFLWFCTVMIISKDTMIWFNIFLELTMTWWFCLACLHKRSAYLWIFLWKKPILEPLLKFIAMQWTNQITNTRAIAPRSPISHFWYFRSTHHHQDLQTSFHRVPFALGGRLGLLIQECCTRVSPSVPYQQHTPRRKYDRFIGCKNAGLQFLHKLGAWSHLKLRRLHSLSRCRLL